MKAVTTLFLLLCIAAQAALSIHLKDAAAVTLPPQSENAHRWDPRLFKVLSIGHLPAAIDWMWIQVLLDQNLSHVAPGTHPGIFYTLDLITDLDPVNFVSYRAGATLVSVVRGDGPGAAELLEKGERFRKQQLPAYPEQLKKDYWQSAWGVPLLLAYVDMFELQDVPKASVAFQEAADIPGAPIYLQSIKKRLQVPGGEYEVGLRLLNFMIQAEKSEEARDRLTKKRNSLFVGQFLADLNRSYQGFLQMRSRMPGSAQSRFADYLRETRTSQRDPWGGSLSLTEAGRIVTTTPHERVFGLD